MVVTITLPYEYSYVLATLLASGVVNQLHGIWTGSARKAAKVPYPNAYATSAEADADAAKYRFNCAQRAHQNYLEMWPTWAVSTAMAGLSYPVATAGLGAVWLLGRVVYAYGYRNDRPDGQGKGRLKGTFYAIGHLGTLGLALWTVGGKMIMGY